MLRIDTRADAGKLNLIQHLIDDLCMILQLTPNIWCLYLPIHMLRGQEFFSCRAMLLVNDLNHAHQST